jgi:Uma2 family endonuclease
LAPDLAVEVLSEGNTRSEMERKLRDYFFSGVRLVWFLDPRIRSATVFTSPDQATELAEGDPLEGGDVLPGLSIPLVQVFAHLARKPETAGSTKPPPKAARKPRPKPG